MPLSPLLERMGAENMRVRLTSTPIEGPMVIEIDYFEDERGFFIESWNRRDFAQAGLDLEFVQENHSRSGKNVLRGLHYQDMTAPMAKLIRCTRGTIYDVAVDLRSESPTFGQWFGLELSAENKKQIYIPVGFAHGFAALSEAAEVQYKQTAFYAPSSEGSVRWNDPDLAIEWPVSKAILSERDRNAQSFREYRQHPAFK